MKWLVAVGIAAALGLAATPARADGDAVALLPLEAGAQLQIYGQPVASEVARALAAGGIEVVVVGRHMTVPGRASVVVDGEILAGASGGDAVTLSLRIRDRETGAVLDRVPPVPSPLTSIDQAAAQLSAQALPKVRQALAAVADRHARERAAQAPHAVRAQPGPRATVPAHGATLAVAVDAAEQAGVPLREELAAAAAAWTRAHHLEPIPIATTAFGAAGAGAALTSPQLALEILGYDARTEGGVPIARARVRARLADAGHVVFDRVIVTDSIVGDREQPASVLAARVAREVLAILGPHAARAWPELAAP